MLFIGDVHGKYEQYKRIIKSVSSSIQVGDMGVGFRRYTGPRDGEIWSNPPHYAMVKGDHRFIRGNHDNPSECKKHSQFIADGTVEGGMMLIGGAQSIDKEFRVEGYSWWADEELSIKELNELTDKFVETKPRMMVTHDCPEEIAEALIAHLSISSSTKLELKSRTRQALQSMWSAYSPKLWVFGHWHHSFDCVLRGTRFVCLDELEAKDLGVSE